MIVILPFEKDFYANYDVKVDFVGHPLLDSLENEKSITKDEFLQKNQLPNKPIIALLPGSRKQEVALMLQTMLKLVPKYPDHQFIIAGVNTLEDKYYKSIIGEIDVSILYDSTNWILKYAAAALVTSGTATLETALIGTPEVVCYKGNRLSYEIAKRIISIKYISLVNLILDKEPVVELIQSDFNTKNLKLELDKLLFDDVKKSQIKTDYQQLKTILGNSGASLRAAEIIVNLFKKKL
jgi:lipid-A-disaccharide synthase